MRTRGFHRELGGWLEGVRGETESTIGRVRRAALGGTAVRASDAAAPVSDDHAQGPGALHRLPIAHPDHPVLLGIPEIVPPVDGRSPRSLADGCH